MRSNLVAFVESKAAGERVAAMFKRGARVDYRPSEPHWVQIKIGACDVHVSHLEVLAVAGADNTICVAQVRAAEVADLSAGRDRALAALEALSIKAWTVLQLLDEMGAVGGTITGCSTASVLAISAAAVDLRAELDRSETVKRHLRGAL